MRSRPPILALTALCFLWPAALASQAGGYGRDLAGHAIVSLTPGGERAAVLFFIASDCPISNRYAPEMLRLETVYTSRDIAFWLVYPNRTETPAAIRAHQAAYGKGHTAHVLTDPRQELVHLTGAKVTPEAALLLSGKSAPTPIYTGRIDDRYLNIGNERPRATRHDLEDAIAATLAGKPVPPPGGPPVGCGIVTTP